MASDAEGMTARKNARGSRVELAAEAPPDDYARYLPAAIANVNVPAYVLDATGRIRWLNGAARQMVGNVVGMMVTEVLAIEPAVARATLKRRLSGEERNDHTVVVVGSDGSRRGVEISSVPLEAGDAAIGMFGLAISREPKHERSPASPLTRRQHEVLVLLAQGASTEAIASHLFLSKETVRNHVRAVLSRLNATSRLAAVANAQRDGLV
jgi:PAS domain S-box-containing protein